jgi:hypothetical protein
MARMRIGRFGLVVLTCGFLAYASVPVNEARPSERPAGARLSQAIVAYGFLRSSYPDFGEVLESHSGSAMARELKALEEALDSLHCDVPIRLAFSHRATTLETLVPGQWVEYVKGNAAPPDEGWLFVVQHQQTRGRSAIVVLSSVAPERTTIFMLEGDFAATLVYDSFGESKISNEQATRVGVLIAIGLDKDGNILLKEWAEPGSRGHFTGSVGRVFQVNVTRKRVTLKDSGFAPRP